MDISLWLIPKKNQQIKLQKHIDYLAQKYHSYFFIPHITIYHFPNRSDLNTIVDFTKNSLKNIKSFNIRFDKLQYSEAFTKTLYASFQLNKSLVYLYKLFYKQYREISDYKLIPHLSFIYKNNMKEKDKCQEIKIINMFPQLTIDRLYIITRENGTIKYDKDVLDWKISFEFKFK